MPQLRWISACAIAIAFGLLAFAGNTSSAPARAKSRLAWSPPRLHHPITIHIRSPTTDLRLDRRKDYILKMPRTAVKPGSDGGLWVNGGHNIVMIGGEFDFTGVVNPSEQNGRVASFFNTTGTIHIEGVWAHGNGLVEGVEMYSPRATLQLENDRFDHLHTEAAGYHSDLIEWGEGKQLRVDRFTGSSEVQGISSFGASGAFDLRQVDIQGLVGSSDPSPVLLGLEMTSATLQNVYVQPRSGEPFGATLRPSGGVAVGPDSIAWPGTGVSGAVRRGSPPSGKFVPAGVAGTRYVSPGYR